MRHPTRRYTVSIEWWPHNTGGPENAEYKTDTYTAADAVTEAMVFYCQLGKSDPARRGYPRVRGVQANPARPGPAGAGEEEIDADQD